MIAPWTNFYREIEALFEKDPQVTIKYNEEARVVSLFVDDAEKADAISKILPTEKTFGGATVKIHVVPANNEDDTEEDVIAKAFKGNPALDYVKTIPTPFGNMTFAVFHPEVVQYYDDDLGDINGLRSTLYQDIANDVLEFKDVRYCTNKVDTGLWAF